MRDTEDGWVEIFFPTILKLVMTLLVDVLIYLVLLYIMDNFFTSQNGRGTSFKTFLNYIKRRNALQGQPDQESNFPLLKATNLSKTYKNGIVKRKKTRALIDLSLSAEKDKITCILGHNGAGKSTLFGILTGLIDFDSGDAFMNNASITNDLKKIRQSIGVCPQHDVLWEELSAYQHLYVYAVLKNCEIKEIDATITSLLHTLRLFKVRHSAVRTFSGGMKRRLSVAIAFLGNSKFIFLDEPTTGLDPLIRRDIWRLIYNSKKGRCVLMTTHSMEEAETLADNILIMVDGMIKCEGNPIQLKRDYSGFQIEIIANMDQAEQIKNEFSNSCTKFQTEMQNVNQVKLTMTIKDDTRMAQLVEFCEQAKLEHFKLRQISLYDLFMQITQQ